ncbi:MAG: FKBP-type peptidyl-prolyl cis-trans isomerase [Cellvibrionaceae bacterium]
MKQRGYIAAAVAVFTLVALGCDTKEAEEVATEDELGTLNEQISYVFGYNIGQQFKSQEIELDVDVVAQAIRDVNNDADPRLSDDEMQAAMQAFQQEHQQKMAAAQAEQQAEMEALAEENRQAGEDFLAGNAEKEGVVTLPSGLQYKQIEAGDGSQPEASDTVTVHYRGTLIDGTVFDSSYERGEPVSFPLQNVIAGWTEGLQHMAEGSKYELYIPPELAYGPGGQGPVIGPNSTLIFEVELLDVVDSEQDADGQQ